MMPLFAMLRKIQVYISKTKNISAYIYTIYDTILQKAISLRSISQFYSPELKFTRNFRMHQHRKLNLFIKQQFR